MWIIDAFFECRWHLYTENGLPYKVCSSLPASGIQPFKCRSLNTLESFHKHLGHQQYFDALKSKINVVSQARKIILYGLNLWRDSGIGLGSTSAATGTPFPLAVFFRDNFDKRLERIPLSSLGNVKLLDL